MTTSVTVDQIVCDASWLAHRYDERGDAVHFVRLDRAAHAQATFITEEYFAADAQRVVLPRAASVAAAGVAAPVHFIFHSAYCLSTLAARAMDLPGVAMGLKEPQILNDLIGWRHRGAAPTAVGRVLDDALRLLARPFGAGEAVVVKPSNVVNPLAGAMLAARPRARALLLYAPLPTYLASIAKKGMWGRLWVRELFGKLYADGLVSLGFDDGQLLGQTDLQIAALGWLGQHRLFAALVAAYPDRVRTLSSAVLTARPAEAMAAMSGLFGLSLDAAGVAAVVAGPAFTSHSKSGAAFDADARAREHADAAVVHGEEIEKVAIWAEAVAAANGIGIDPGAGLLSVPSRR